MFCLALVSCVGEWSKTTNPLERLFLGVLYRWLRGEDLNL